jgi:epoxyqueuosine reductase
MAALDQAGAERLRERLRALGFDVVRFARAEPAFGPGLEAWLAAGNHADMAWLERGAAKRGDPELVLPGARTMVMLGVNYGRAERGNPNDEIRMTKEGGGAEGGDLATKSAKGAKMDVEEGGARSAEFPRTKVERGKGGGGVGVGVGNDAFPLRAEEGAGGVLAWARYSLYSDYHDTMGVALAEAGRVLEELGGIGPGDHRYYVDTGPVLERGWAARAGVGFTGKNAMLISREFGNWLFLSCIVTRLEVPADAPLPGKPPEGTHAGQLCGKCTRCMDACPTDAFAAPGVVDARRCVAYQTIENKGVIPRELRPGIGNRIYGCDTCLEVCPWNRFAQASREILLTARPEVGRLTLAEVLALTPERFAEVFRKTAIKRVKLAGLLRNACVVAGNTGARECVERLAELADAGGAGAAWPMVRVHAVWALARLGETGRLAELRARETDAAVLEEYAAARGAAEIRMTKSE